jgi:hypothetical protein
VTPLQKVLEFFDGKNWIVTVQFRGVYLVKSKHPATLFIWMIIGSVATGMPNHFLQYQSIWYIFDGIMDTNSNLAVAMDKGMPTLQFYH